MNGHIKSNMDIFFGSVLMLFKSRIELILSTPLEDTDHEGWRVFFGDTVYKSSRGRFSPLRNCWTVYVAVSRDTKQRPAGILLVRLRAQHGRPVQSHHQVRQARHPQVPLPGSSHQAWRSEESDCDWSWNREDWCSSEPQNILRSSHQRSVYSAVYISFSWLTA